MDVFIVSFKPVSNRLSGFVVCSGIVSGNYLFAHNFSSYSDVF